MTVRLFFKIPENSMKMMDIVCSVPDNWKHISGRIIAPKSLIEADKVANRTGILVNGINDYRIVGGLKEDGKTCDPDIFAMVIVRLLPEFADFSVNSRGIGCLETVKKFANGLIISGYRGSLLFGKSIPNEQEFESPYSAECSLELSPWVGNSDSEFGPQPARMRLAWNEENSGSYEDTKTILSVCRKLCLSEYSPNAV